MKFNHIIILTLLALFIYACNSNALKEESFSDTLPDSNVITTTRSEVATDSTANSDTTQSPIPPNFNLLNGEWIRTDGGYVISIQNIAGNGTLKAGYYNPNPINVGRAEWIYDNSNLLLYVELQDVNYPGSNYTLQYFPTEDKLAGNYFQAVEGNNYEVIFDRKK